MFALKGANPFFVEETTFQKGDKQFWQSWIPWKYIDFPLRRALWAKFSAEFRNMFPIFHRKLFLTFHAKRNMCLISQKTGFDISCKLTICKKRQTCFLGDMRKKYHQCVVCWISTDSGKGWIITEYCIMHQQTAKILMRLCRRTWWSDPLHFLYTSKMSLHLSSLTSCYCTLLKGKLYTARGDNSAQIILPPTPLYRGSALKGKN